jgi:adenosylmethionine---8-amino-7-oxononanoate aminotransferase
MFDTDALVAADKRFLWHPFTQMRDWCDAEHDPLVLVSGNGALLKDSKGREYIDGNSSIWTNLHGHNHPKLNAALHAQLDKVAHTSFLGFTNPPAIQLAEELVKLFPAGTLSRVFFSDDGSTAMEAALKMAVQYWQLCGRAGKQQFIAFSNAYHGDTMGASSLGGVPLFHGRFSAFQFPAHHLSGIHELENIDPANVAAVVIEPLIQGAAGIRLWPQGMLAALRAWCDQNDVLLIADEVMTGFGRTGSMFACEQENVVPDLLALAKGLTGGYLPLSATLTTETIFEAFLGTFEEQKTFYYGHSYTGSQLGCSVALASLAIFREEQVLQKLDAQIDQFRELLTPIAGLRHVHEVRQRGFVAGIELMRNRREPYDWRMQTGAQVCAAARRHGLLTRPIRDTIVLMPPYCITAEQLERATNAIRLAILEVCNGG